jgi:putative endonuclease
MTHQSEEEDESINFGVCLGKWTLMADPLGGKMSTVKTYYVYIMTNRSRTLYTGITNNLERRVLEHKRGQIDGFTQKYRINRLIFFETTSNVIDAIKREKQIKSWTRAKKIELIEKINPEWHDLSEDWY